MEDRSGVRLTKEVLEVAKDLAYQDKKSLKEFVCGLILQEKLLRELAQEE